MLVLKLACVIGLLIPVQESPNSDVKTLVTNVRSKDKTVRLKAILELGQRIETLKSEDDKKAASKVIIEAIASQDTVVNSAAKFRIGQNTKLFNSYLGPFLESADFKNFALGCEAIKVIGPEARNWIEKIEPYLDSDDRGFRLASLHALAALDGKDILPLLDETIESLDSKDFNIQLSACRVISKIGPSARKAGPKLVELLEKGNASARSWASIALGAIGPHAQYEVVDLLEKRLDRFYVVDRQRALIGLAHLGAEATSTLPKVKMLMETPNKSVQHTAARTYWKITGKSDAALETLVSLIPSMVYGGDSMDIIGEMGPAAIKAVPEMIKQLKSEEVTTREAACYALASMGAGAKAATEPLSKIMKGDKDLLVRAVAEMAIEEIEKPVEQVDGEK